MALQIIKHIKDLDPPGRFLKRDGRGQGSRGLNGPWDELTEREAIKKTCQALRDCNRQDRQGYAKGVAAPGDVIKVVQEVSHIPAKERAAAAAHAIATEATTNALNAISVAATSNSSAVPRASDTGNDAASSVSTSSNKRLREEANSLGDVIESSSNGGGGNFSSPSSSYYSAQQYHQADPRFGPGSAGASSVMATSNYHMAAPQSGLHYQPQHNPYSTLQQQAHHHHHHHHQPSQFPVNIAPYGNVPPQHPGFPSPAPNAGPSYYPTASTNASDYLMPMAAAQAPTPYQDVLLSAMASSSSAAGNVNHSHQQHLHNNNFYQNADPYSNNNNLLPNSSMINQDHQVIKKQRTDDTDPSTGPSEQSPVNATNIGSIKEEGEDIQNEENGGKNEGGNGSAQNDASAPAPTLSNDGDENENDVGEIEIEPEQGSHHNGADTSELFDDVDARNIVNGNGENVSRSVDEGGNNVGGNSNNNSEVSSWVAGPNNPSSLENTDQFHDALSGF